jgi:hypothetical protein
MDFLINYRHTKNSRGNCSRASFQLSRTLYTDIRCCLTGDGEILYFLVREIRCGMVPGKKTVEPARYKKLAVANRSAEHIPRAAASNTPVVRNTPEAHNRHRPAEIPQRAVLRRLAVRYTPAGGLRT